VKIYTSKLGLALDIMHLNDMDYIPFVSFNVELFFSLEGCEPLCFVFSVLYFFNSFFLFCTINAIKTMNKYFYKVFIFCT